MKKKDRDTLLALIRECINLGADTVSDFARDIAAGRATGNVDFEELAAERAPLFLALMPDREAVDEVLASVDRLLEHAGYAPDSSARHNLSIARSLLNADDDGCPND